ncbi:MAG: sigma 54-interacting transcriptional regulator [Deltaproteobacteria bacterium]|nr:sigma 54-interacting transcriptional regulator [Deltaproteobacteria bacterium]
MDHTEYLDYETYKEVYGLVSETLNTGFMLLDWEFGIVDVNDKFLAMVGCGVDQKEMYVGHNLREFYDDLDQFTEMANVLKVLDEKGFYQYEGNLNVICGHDLPVLVSVNNIPDVPMAGKHDGIATVLFTDIKDQKRAQASLEITNRELFESKAAIDNKNNMLEAILFGIGDCVAIFDMDGQFLLSNPKSMKIRGNRKTPLLALEPGTKKELTFHLSGQAHYYTGRMEGIYDAKGKQFAYAEILKDISHEIELKNRNQELLEIKREFKYDALKTKMIGVSKAMRGVFEVVFRCAGVVSPVLILGETGVGKEVVARAIHENSDRKDKAFVAINCSALPDTLLESELFGHVKGAFTGAISDRPGLFREAHGGTLFLDEVGDLKLPLQAKLLRALQEGEVRPVGGNRSFPADVRILSATNCDLKTLANQKLFRQDLYYRLAVIPIFIPPLRDRKEDILPLADHFMKKQSKIQNIQVKRLDRITRNFLLNFSWPGNIRELENAVEYALAMATGSQLSPGDFPMQNAAYPVPEAIKEFASRDQALETAPTPYPSLKTLEKEKMDKDRNTIFEALRLHEGKRALAAEELGISKSTLWRKIKKYKMDQ